MLLMHAEKSVGSRVDFVRRGMVNTLKLVIEYVSPKFVELETN